MPHLTPVTVKKTVKQLPFWNRREINILSYTLCVCTLLIPNFMAVCIRSEVIIKRQTKCQLLKLKQRPCLAKLIILVVYPVFISSHIFSPSIAVHVRSRGASLMTSWWSLVSMLVQAVPPPATSCLAPVPPPCLLPLPAATVSISLFLLHSMLIKLNRYYYVL